MNIYPEKNNPTQITKLAGAWNDFTGITEIIPADTVTKEFIIKNISIIDIKEIGNYQIRVYKGAAGFEQAIMTSCFTYSTKKETEICADGEGTIAANSRISISIIGDMVAESDMKVYIQYAYVYS